VAVRRPSGRTAEDLGGVQRDAVDGGAGQARLGSVERSVDQVVDQPTGLGSVFDEAQGDGDGEFGRETDRTGVQQLVVQSAGAESVGKFVRSVDGEPADVIPYGRSVVEDLLGSKWCWGA